MDNMLQDSLMEPNPSPVNEGKPYFMGDFALIKFSGGEEGFGPEVYWLVNKEDHTIRPFESPMALDAAFGEDLQDALKKTVVIASPILDGDNDIVEGVLADFNILGPEYMIKEDGTSEPLRFSRHQLKGRYGKPINDEQEVTAERAVDALLNELSENKSGSAITSKFINKLRDDQQLMAFYISAMAYGGYSIDDIKAEIIKSFHQSKKE